MGILLLGVGRGTGAPGGAASTLGAFVRRTTNQTIGAGDVAVSFDTADYDPSTLWDGATKFTAPQTGWYLHSPSVIWAVLTVVQGGVVNSRANGSVMAHVSSSPSQTNMNVPQLNGAAMLRLASTEYVETTVSHGATNIDITQAQSGIVTCDNWVGTKVVRSTDQTISDVTPTAISWSSVESENAPASYWAAGNPTRLTCANTGWHIFSTDMLWTTSVGLSGVHLVYYKINGGSDVYVLETGTISTAQNNVRQSFCLPLYLSAGDYVEAWVYQADGGSRAIDDAHASLIYAPSSLGTRVTRSSTQTISNNSETAISWSSATRDDETLWDSATKITVPRNGFYLVSANVTWTANTTGYRGGRIRVNGAGTEHGCAYTSTQNPEGIRQAAMVMRLTAGDYIEFMAYQNSGGNLNAADTNFPFMAVLWLAGS